MAAVHWRAYLQHRLYLNIQYPSYNEWVLLTCASSASVEEDPPFPLLRSACYAALIRTTRTAVNSDGLGGAVARLGRTVPVLMSVFSYKTYGCAVKTSFVVYFRERRWRAAGIMSKSFVDWLCFE